MRRRSIAVLTAASAAALAALAGRRASERATDAFAPDALAPVELAPGVFCLGPSGRTQTNVYFVRAGPAWFLVDAGWRGDARRIEAAARSLLGPDVLPAAILLTHVHPDHAGAARDLAATWRCPIVMHPAEMPIAAGDFAAMRRVAGPLDRWAILPVMTAMGERRRNDVLARGRIEGRLEALDPSGIVTGLDGWTWLPTPGHTPGHVSFVRTADRLVLTGDALVTLRVNDVTGLLLGRQGISGPPWYTTWSGAAARSSIGALAALEPAIVGGGHGRPLAGGDTAALVHAFARRVASTRPR